MKKYMGFGLLLLSFVIPVFVNAQTDVDPNGSASSCVTLTYNLSYRSRDASTGGQVSTLQDYLQSAGYINSEPTGYFGLLTVKAVQSFQTANGITPNGYVGPLTRAAINSKSCLNLPTVTPTYRNPCPAGAQFSSENGKPCNIVGSSQADVIIKTNLAQARAQAAIYYDSHGNYAGVCTNSGGILSFISRAAAQLSSAQYVGGNGSPFTYNTYGAFNSVVCHDSASSWVAMASLKNPGNTGGGWCVDSTGLSMEETYLSAGAMVCASSSVPTSLLGDVNLDGKVDIIDAQQLSRYIKGLVTFTTQQTINADVNKDGQVNTADVNLISQYSVGTITVFPTTTSIRPSVSLTANGIGGTTTVPYGSTVRFNWTLGGDIADTAQVGPVVCTRFSSPQNPNWSGSTPAMSGYYDMSVTGNATYQLFCSDSANVGASSTVVVNIQTTPITVISPNGGGVVDISKPIIVQFQSGAASPAKHYINLMDQTTNHGFALDGLLGTSGLSLTQSQIDQGVQTVTFPVIPAWWTANLNDPYKIEICVNNACDKSDNTFSIINGSISSPNLLGDVNLDGKVDIIDAQQISRFSAGQSTLNSQQVINADVNKDGKVDANDSALIAKYAVGLITSF